MKELAASPAIGETKVSASRHARRAEAVFDHDPRRALKLHQVTQIIGVGKSTLYEMISAGLFPAPIKVGPAGGSAVWLRQWVDDYIDQQIAARDAKAA